MLLRLQRIDTGQFLILAKDNVLTVEIRSTLFNNQDELLGSFSYEGKMPLEPNRHLIQNAHLINTSVDLRTFQVQMYLGDLPYKQVNFNFTITDDEISYHLLIDTSVLANRLKTLKLNQLITSELDEQLHFPTYADFKAYITSTISAVPGELPFVFFPFKNDGAYKIIDPESEDYPSFNLPINIIMNNWAVTDGVGGFTFDPAGGPYKNTFIPAIYVTRILKRICKYFGVTPAGKWLKEEASNKIVILSNVPVLSIGFMPDLSYFMPDVGVNEFLKFARTEYGLLIDFDLTRGIGYIESFENLENTNDILDLSFRQIYGFRETTNTLQSYKISRGTDDKDAAFTDDEKNDLPSLYVGDQSGIYEITDIDLISVATKMVFETRPFSAANWRIPCLKQPIYGATPFDQISELQYADKYKFKLRPLLWHGMVSDSSAFDYPYASIDNLDRNGQAISEQSLNLDSSGSALIAVNRMYNFIKESKPFEFGFFCHRTEFFKLNPKTRIVLKDRNLATVVCLLDGAVADFAQASEIFAKATVYPIIRKNVVKLVTPVIPPPPPEPPYDNGEVYVKLVRENLNNEYYYQPKPDWRILKADIKLYFYADAAGTIPKNVVNLQVSLEYKQYYSWYSTVLGHYNIICNGEVFEVAHQDTVYTSQGGQPYSWSYFIDPNAKYHILT